ncbi:MAG TPA: sulfatase-like hydrolase/transferase [Sedimentisphaerales bacterium]|nr:sulfatase-like hydrolase/transferase [Sedimentisphaerales bacterium]
MSAYNYTRRDFLKALGVGAAALTLPGCGAFRRVPAGTLEHRPNIIFIMTDDQADWAFGAAPNPDAYSPNINKLCSEGVRLANCFVTTPVCSPSRASLLTSRYGTEVGITDFIKSKKVGLAPTFATWPRILADAGYATALIGKWHLGDKDECHPTLFGYTEFTGFRWGGEVSMDPKIEVGGDVRQVQGYTPDILTDYAIDFIRRTKAGPFVLSLHYWAPHASTVSRAPDGGHTWLPLSGADYSRFGNMDPKIPNPDYPRLDVPLVERMMREYLGSVASVDRNLGRLLAVVDELELSDNTVIVFTSDNGYNVGHHAVEGKGNASWTLTDNRDEGPNMYDNSLRVPAIIRWPKVIRPGMTIEQTISFLDWFPTLLAIAGLKVPKGEIIRGRNFLPLLKGKRIEWDNDLFVQYTMRGAGTMRAYRAPRWKLVRDFDHFIKDELYDLLNDPAETTNLIDSPDPLIQNLRRSLNAKLLDKMRSINDPALGATEL